MHEPEAEERAGLGIRRCYPAQLSPNGSPRLDSRASKQVASKGNPPSCRARSSSHKSASRAVLCSSVQRSLSLLRGMVISLTIVLQLSPNVVYSTRPSSLGVTPILFPTMARSDLDRIQVLEAATDHTP